MWNYEFHAEDHDATDKTLFGHSDNLDGADVIDLIVQQPSCHVFIARHLYNFFVADEPQVPAWPIQPPRDPEAIRDICDVFVKSDYNLKPVLRAIFTSDFFKEASFKRVRNPAEVFAGTLRVTGSFPEPHPDWKNISLEPSYMGQQLYDPPSVEGWHTGHEWINSGAFVQRVNFMADQLGDTSLPGVQDIIRRIASSNGKGMSPDQLVDGCLEQMGPLQVKDSTRSELIDFVQSETDQISWHNGDYEKGADVTCKVLALITGTREYQFG